MHMILFHNIESNMKGVLVSLFKFLLKIRFLFNKPLVLKNRDTEYSIFFAIHSVKEYFLRYKLSYIADPSTIPTPNHIKTDVAGFESEVISGMHSLLFSNSLGSICIEIADTFSIGKLELVIDSCGFSRAFFDYWTNNNGAIYNTMYIR